MDFRIDPEIRKILMPLSAEEMGQLEKNLLSRPGYITLTVWKERNVLLDGHNRYELYRKRKLPNPLERPQDENVFTCSMADLFGKWVPDEWIMRVFERVKAHPEWNFLFLTKFPQRLRAVCDALDGFPENAWVGCTVDSQARVSPDAKRRAELVKKYVQIHPAAQADQTRLAERRLSPAQHVALGRSASSPCAVARKPWSNPRIPTGCCG